MIYDDEGRMMTGTDHHYTDESIRARIEQLRRFASGSHESAVEWINLDWRGFCNTTRHILSSLYAALESEQTEAYAEGRKDEREESAKPPAPLPESMSRDEMLRYYSEYANLVCGEVVGYQKRIHELQMGVQETLEALRIVKQALPEVRQAALNPNWFTHGEVGARRHFVHWHGKALDAVNSALASLEAGMVQGAADTLRDAHCGNDAEPTSATPESARSS